MSFATLRVPFSSLGNFLFDRSAVVFSTNNTDVYSNQVRRPTCYDQDGTVLLQIVTFAGDQCHTLRESKRKRKLRALEICHIINK